jgi:hypothetical protein
MPEDHRERKTESMRKIFFKIQEIQDTMRRPDKTKYNKLRQMSHIALNKATQ